MVLAQNDEDDLEPTKPSMSVVSANGALQIIAGDDTTTTATTLSVLVYYFFAASGDFRAAQGGD